MKKPKRKHGWCWLAGFALLPICAAILDDAYVTRIPDVAAFGCQWYGGSMATMRCQCQEGAQEMIVAKDSIPSFDTARIDFTNCPKITFKPNSISEMRNLREVVLNNIDSITFDEKSLAWYGYRDVNLEHIERFDVAVPSLEVEITNSNVEKISSEAFSGRIKKISFDGVVVNDIEPFAFSNLMQNGNLTLRDVELKNVKLQSFKRFGTEVLNLENVRANLIPSRAFANITVHDSFTIYNCTFDIVRPGAFTVFNPRNFNVENTKITQLDGEAFAVTTRGDVTFKNNIFVNVNDGAFLAVKLNKNEVFGSRVITFDSNIFSYLTRQSLSVQDFTPKFVNLNLNTTCDCSSIDHNFESSEFYSEIRCIFHDEYQTIREFKSKECSIVSSNFTVIIVACVVLLSLGLISLAMYVYYIKVYKSKKYGSEKQGKVNNLSLIVPDGRTYRETELHVIVERTDLLTTDL